VCEVASRSNWKGRSHQIGYHGPPSANRLRSAPRRAASQNWSVTVVLASFGQNSALKYIVDRGYEVDVLNGPDVTLSCRCSSIALPCRTRLRRPPQRNPIFRPRHFVKMPTGPTTRHRAVPGRGKVTGVSDVSSGGRPDPGLGPPTALRCSRCLGSGYCCKTYQSRVKNTGAVPTLVSDEHEFCFSIMHYRNEVKT